MNSNRPVRPSTFDPAALMPHSPEAEMSLLGCLICDPRILPTVLRVATAQDFYDPRNGLIFDAIDRCTRTTFDLDLVLLIESIPKGEAERLGITIDYLSNLVENVPSPVGHEHYAKIVANRARQRQFIQHCHESVYAVAQEPGDIASLIASHCERIAGLTRNVGGASSVKLQTAVDEVIATLEAGTPASLRTGYAEFDHATGGGVPKSGVWSIFGYPAGGKSTFALSVALNFALGLRAVGETPAQPKSIVRYFSVEQSPQRAVATLLSARLEREVHAMLNSGRASEADLNDMADAGLHMGACDFAFFEQSMDPNKLFVECAALAAKHGHGVLVVDYIQDIAPFDKFIDTTPRITEAMRILSRIARELGWLVIIVSQLDKSAGKANQAPKLSDGLFSSAIEQRSDLISYVWRPHQRELPPTPRDEMEGMPTPAWIAWDARYERVLLGVIKNKYGTCGVAQMQFQRRFMKFITPPTSVTQHWGELKDA